MDRLKVVFHINERNRWEILLANINNLIKDLGKENIIIEVVANGSAVIDYIPNDDTDHNKVLKKVMEFSGLGVYFTACRNSLNGNGISENLLSQHIIVVSAGVTQLVKKQSEGYSYIKP